MLFTNKTSFIYYVLKHFFVPLQLETYNKYIIYKK